MVFSKVKQKIDMFFHRFQVSLYVFSVSCTGLTISVENRTTDKNNDLWIAQGVNLSVSLQQVKANVIWPFKVLKVS